MKIKLIIGLLILSLVAVPLFAIACGEEGPAGEEEWGEPQYGGTITKAVTSLPQGYDPYNWQYTQQSLWYEPLWYPDWTLDPDSEIFRHNWLPDQYWVGNIAKSWEWTDGQTLVVTLRQDVYWQDKEPVNGRQFVADDVVFHFNRMMGWGEFADDGPSTYFMGRFDNCVGISAQGDFTVTFEFAQPNMFTNANSIIAEAMLQAFEAPEVYEMGEPLMEEGGLNSALNEFENQVGTGPFMATELVPGTSVTMDKNPNYWGYDERHPENHLPYVDTVKYLLIPDQASQLAAIRSGQIDIIQELGLTQALSLQETNPELLWDTYAYPGTFIQLRCDTAPFTDIRVRKALQLAVNLEEIAETYYKGTLDPTPVGVINPAYEGFATPYDEWSAELQAEYGYDPDAAMDLLAEAAADGVFEVNDLGGFDTNIITAPSGPGVDMELLQVIQQYFLAIGVDMEIDARADFWSVMNLIMDKAHTQMVMMGMSDDTPPQKGMVFYSAQDPTNGLCQNDPVWEDMVTAVQLSTNKEETQRLCCEVDQYWLEKHWGVTFLVNQQYVFWQPYIKGYSGQKADSYTANYLAIARMWVNKD